MDFNDLGDIVYIARTKYGLALWSVLAQSILQLVCINRAVSQK